MHKAYLSLGSNLGNSARNLDVAVQQIGDHCGTVRLQSPMYQTEPWGFSSPNRFANMAIEIDTTLEPLQLLHTTQAIERTMGRVSKSVKQHYTDRIIDIDILFYDNYTICSEELILPHPLIAQRLFVLQPLSDIAPHLVHPTLHERIDTLCAQLKRHTENQDSQIHETESESSRPRQAQDLSRSEDVATTE